MYKLVKKEFTAPNHQKRIFWLREDTNDFDIIFSAFSQDKYKILSVKFEPKDIVVDLGAHIGAVTLLLTTIRPDIRIFAYEPVVDNFDLLLKNIQENKTENEIHLNNQAVWFYDDTDAKIYFGDNSLEGKANKFIGSQFLIQPFYRPQLFKIANVTTLNKAFEDNRIWSCRLMKMDVEGAEYGILKAAPKPILEMIENIHGEYHNIEPDRIKMPRAMLLKQAKKVFKDVTGQPEKGAIGPFFFKKK